MEAIPRDADKTAGVLEKDVEGSPSPSNVSETSLAFNRETFLASFTAEEDKAIMRKVDLRFLCLIGCMYLLKNVSGRFHFIKKLY